MQLRRISSMFCWLLILISLGGCAATPLVISSRATVAIPSATFDFSVPPPTITVAPSATTIPVTPTVTNMTVSPPARAPDALPVVSGDLSNQIARLEGSLPRANSNGFVIPDNQQMAAFQDMLTALGLQDTFRAVALARDQSYELLLYQDRGDNNSQSYLLREIKPPPYGWGLYVLRLHPSNNLIIEAPHPISDDDTPLVALHIFRALQGRALLIAGAQRDANVDGSADAAHHSQTIFQALHVALSAQEFYPATSTFSSPPIVLQIHGFSASKHPDYPQVIIGHDQGVHSDLLDQLAAELKAVGITAGVCDGYSWQDLCGETNVQSNHTPEGVFIHLELDRNLRSDDQRLLAALKKVFPFSSR